MTDSDVRRPITMSVLAGVITAAAMTCAAAGDAPDAGRGPAASMPQGWQNTLVYDDHQGHTVTLGAIAVMIIADKRAAPAFNMAPPGPQAVTELAQALRANFAGFDPGMKVIMTHAQTDVPAGLSYLQSLRNNGQWMFDHYRPIIMAGNGEGERLMRLTQVLAVAGDSALKHGGSGGGGSMATGMAMGTMLHQQDMMQNELMRAGRSGSPSCNAFTGAAQQNPAFCNPFQP